MAAAIKALNARLRQNPYLDYVCSTHFWGPVSNFGIPVAAVLDTQKDAEMISGRMTAALAVYSTVFARYSLAVQPRNWLLFGCHVINTGAQLTQLYRWNNYWNFGGREKALKEGALKGDVAALGEGAKELVGKAKETVKEATK